MARRVVSAAVLVWTLAAALHAQDYPAHTGKVNDFAGLLTSAERASLEAQLIELERATSAEIAVVTVTSLAGRTVEEYAAGLFHSWGIGKADKDNGVLLLVAPRERAIRIEVGYGLEGILPDGLAGALIRETFLPRFRDGDYRAGLLEGTARVVDIVRRNETLTPEQRAALDRAEADSGKSWAMAAFMGLFVLLGAFGFGTGAGARVAGQLLFSTGFLVIGLVLALITAPRAAVLLLVGLAAVTIVVGHRLGRRPKWRRELRGGDGSGTWWTGWSSGGSGNSSSASSGSDSSSGDFGGGSSGGGGASGHW